MNYNLFSPLKNIYEHIDNELDNGEEIHIEQATTLLREGTEHNLVDSVDEIIDTRDVIEEKETDIDEQTEDNQGIIYLILLFALYYN